MKELDDDKAKIENMALGANDPNYIDSQKKSDPIKEADEYD